jgi:hypothetical protein
MAKHRFLATFEGPAHETLAKAKGAIEKAGGRFDGDEKEGKFTVPTPAGKVKGKYAVTGQSFTVKITDKPFLVPRSAIERRLHELLRD